MGLEQIFMTAAAFETQKLGEYVLDKRYSDLILYTLK